MHGIRSDRQVPEELWMKVWNSAFRWVYLFFSPWPLASLSFLAICKASSDNHFAFLHLFFLGMVLITASCTILWTSAYSSSGTLSIRSDALNLFVTSTWFRSYLNRLVVFPTFFNLSLNLAIRSLWSEPQSAPGLVLLTVYCFSTFGCKEYNQSDFGVGHLVLSMCRVFSCVIWRGCFLWPVYSLGKLY